MDHMISLQRDVYSEDILGTSKLISVTPQPRKKSINAIEMQMNSVMKKRKGKIKIIGICGGHSCGKTKIANHFQTRITGSVILAEKDFFKCLQVNRKKSFQDEKDNRPLIDEFDGYSQERKFHLVDLSNPDSYDHDALIDGLTKLKNDQPFTAPHYDEELETIYPSYKEIKPESITMIFVEGTFIYKNAKLRELFDFRMYIEVDDDVRLSRMILRENIYLKDNALAFKTFFIIYEKFIKTSFEMNVETCKKYANLILPNFSITEDDEIEGDPTMEFLLVNLQNLNKLSTI